MRIVLSRRAQDGVEEPKLDSADGLLERNKPWSEFLLKKPVQGHVTGVLKDGRAIIDLGSAEGVKFGMALLAVEKAQQQNRIARRPDRLTTVVAVESHRCTAQVKEPNLFRGFKKDQLVYSRIPKEIVERESRSFFW